MSKRKSKRLRDASPGWKALFVAMVAYFSFGPVAAIVTVAAMGAAIAGAVWLRRAERASYRPKHLAPGSEWDR